MQAPTLEVYELFLDERDRHWEQCGLARDGTPIRNETPVPEETRLEWLQRLAESDEAALAAFETKLDAAAVIIQTAWRRRVHRRSASSLFLIM